MGLKRKDPFPTNTCTFKDPKCQVKQGVDCSQVMNVYKITCLSCTKEMGPSKGPDKPGKEKSPHYIGMTTCSLHNRMKTHQSHQSSGNMKGPQARHDKECHQGEKQVYQTEIVAKERKLLTLYTNEALWIEGQDPQSSLNERQEGGRGGVVRIIATRVTH